MIYCPWLEIIRHDRELGRFFRNEGLFVRGRTNLFFFSFLFFSIPFPPSKIAYTFDDIFAKNMRTTCAITRDKLWQTAIIVTSDLGTRQFFLPFFLFFFSFSFSQVWTIWFPLPVIFCTCNVQLRAIKIARNTRNKRNELQLCRDYFPIHPATTSTSERSNTRPNRRRRRHFIISLNGDLGKTNSEKVK